MQDGNSQAVVPWLRLAVASIILSFVRSVTVWHYQSVLYEYDLLSLLR